jgi:uncharacterized protein
MERVTITDAARELVHQLRNTHGPLLFHQSGGCCDGSAPMCLLQSDFKVGGQDWLLGNVADCPYYIAKDTFTYYRRSQITIDVAPGRGASFSLEIPLGVRFVTVSTILDEAAIAQLPPPVAASL